ncbi:MAG: Maf-like protein [Nevskia sp.]
MPSITPQSPLILASGSRYRAELLQRLSLPFVAEVSQVDETPLAGELPAGLAARLALAKARTVAQRRPGRWVLGSDQVVACGAQILGKPGDRATAIAQLEAQSGRIVEFLTAMVLLHDALAAPLTHLDCTRVQFRRLRRAEIEAYVEAEPAYDCAGSFKSEGLGISLCEKIETEDPTGLVGLPLIATCRLLATAGWPIP